MPSIRPIGIGTTKSISGRRLQRRMPGLASTSPKPSGDMRTAGSASDDFVAVQGSGKGHSHPILAAGQIAGRRGVAQGIGLALYENVVWQQGRMVNGQMTNYIMPTSLDVPPIRVFFEEICPTAFWPGGQKALASFSRWNLHPRLPMQLLNADLVRDIRRIPVTPEVLLEMLEKVHA